jgi:hypothetical protein
MKISGQFQATVPLPLGKFFRINTKREVGLGPTACWNVCNIEKAFVHEEENTRPVAHSSVVILISPGLQELRDKGVNKRDGNRTGRTG